MDVVPLGVPALQFQVRKGRTQGLCFLGLLVLLLFESEGSRAWAISHKTVMSMLSAAWWLLSPRRRRRARRWTRGVWGAAPSSPGRL